MVYPKGNGKIIFKVKSPTQIKSISIIEPEYSNLAIDGVITSGSSNLKSKTKIDEQEISEVLTVNGVRFSFQDGSWGLIRASSNKPSLVIVTESPTSDDRKKKIFDFIDNLLQKTGKIGKYDQKI